MGSRHYPLRVTRSAFGIRAQDLRTLARGTWWARRWIAALEAMRLGARFGRGRQYAVGGQVTDLVAEGPHVSASVVGSRPDPYRVTLDFTAAEGAALADDTVKRCRFVLSEPGVQVVVTFGHIGQQLVQFLFHIFVHRMPFLLSCSTILLRATLTT